MKNKGIKRTTLPLLYEVNYPEHGQVGFLVRMNRRGRRIYKIFNFSQHGSKDQTRKAAEQYAKQLSREYPLLSRQELAVNRKAGVRRVVKKARGREFTFWEASWSPKPNKVKRVLFSVKKYGSGKAKDLALEARSKGLASMR